MTPITLISLLALCSLVMTIKERKKSLLAYQKYKAYYEEYRKLFGSHAAMKQAYSEWTDHLFLCLTFLFISIISVGTAYSLITSGLWKVM